MIENDDSLDNHIFYISGGVFAVKTIPSYKNKQREKENTEIENESKGLRLKF